MMIEIETKLQEFLESQSDDLKQNYEDWISELEYNILKESNNVEYKSREWFDIRTNAFSIRKNSAMKLLTMWVKKYKSTKNCPVLYKDTLDIPFKEIKAPKTVTR
jgi:hypothetical protein